MSPSPSHPDRGGRRPRLSSLSTGRVAFAALSVLAAAACSGEQALVARDASALSGGGGLSGKGGTGGSGGGAGTTGVAGGGGGTAGTGLAGGGTVGTAGASGTVGTAGSGGTSAGGTGAPGGTSGGQGGATTGGRGGGAGGRPTGPGADGSTCSTGGDCMSSYCWDGVCCATDCAGNCMTCAGTTKGVCAPAADGTDPRDKCDTMTAASCGTTGFCNGAGACRYHPSTQVCGSTPACDSTNSSVVSMRVCNGAGACVAGPTQSCNGFLCSAATCGTSCSADSGCASNGFCSASACFTSANLAGNGDLETGTTLGWLAANGGGVLGLSSVAASGVAHSGANSVFVSSRSIHYQGPGYNLPTGPGKYTISGWALQRDVSSILGVLQVRLACRQNVNPGYFVDVNAAGQFGVTMNQNMWTLFTATIDTSTAGVDCLPTGATPGLVRLATLYLNHTPDTAAPYPDLYLDDVVVQVPDGHNLVGNPNFEAGLVDGWSLSAGSSTLSVSDTVAHVGTHSLHQSTRSVPAAGPKYLLPTGAARYAFSVWVQHTGTQTRDLILQPSYACISPSGQVLPASIATATAVPGGTWTQLSGTATFPPANAPAGCKLAAAAVHVQHDGTACGSGSGQVECPDLYLDDVSITIAP